MKKLAAIIAAAASLAGAADLTQYLDKGYAIGTDNVGRGVRVFKATEAGTSEVVWEWLCNDDANFNGGDNSLLHTSEVKVRNGGRTVLVVGATDWAVVDVSGDTPFCTRSGHANDGGHGIDILPDGTIVKGDSWDWTSPRQGFIYLIPEDGTAKNAYNLSNCHGVEWDDARGCLWAIGYTNLVKLAYDSNAKTLTRIKEWQLPGTSGHCLDLAEDGKLYTTDWSGVRRFDPETETFTTLYALSNPKSISHSETYGDIVELPTPAVYSDNYSANKVRVYPVSGDASNYYEVTPSPQMSMYRARWLTSNSPTYGIDASVVETEWGSIIAADPGKAGKYDMTSSAKLLCAPNRSVSNWSTSQARAMTTIYPYQGRLWTSGGDWYNNTGSSPVFSIDPATGAYTKEYTAGTETIWYFREGADGSLYIPGVDQNERDNNYDQGGAYFWRKTDGTWVKYLCNSNQTDRILRVPFGSIPQSGYNNSPYYEGMLMHTFDLVNWKGKTFVCGYGIAWGEEGGYECMSNATVNVTTETRSARSIQGWFTTTENRFTTFLPFADHLFCFNETRRSMNDGDYYPFQQWRFNEATGQFDMTEVPWADIAPGLPPTASVSPSTGAVMLWHPTPFKDRVLYIVGVEGTSCRPWILCSAEDDGGNVKATKIDLGEGVYPFAITKYDDKVAVVAGTYDSSDGTVINSVWESSDGLNFRRLFSFKSTRQAAAMARIGDDFFFGMGYSSYCPYTWSLKGEDTVGNIYRIHFDHVFTPVALGPAMAAVKDNGSSAILSTTVTCIDADSASMSLSFDGAVVTNWTDVAEGETYRATVETTPGTGHSFVFTAMANSGETAVASGAFAASAVEGWFTVDFSDAGYKEGTGWKDLTDVNNPGGTWSGGADDGTAFVAPATARAPKHLELCNSLPVVYRPTSASSAGDDVVVTGRVSIAAGEALPAFDGTAVASLFFAATNDEIRACGNVGEGWRFFDRTAAPLVSGQWADFAMELDLNSEAAPRVQFRLDGVPLTLGSQAWLALPPAAANSSIAEIAFAGAGGVALFAGDTRAKIIAELVLTEADAPVIGDADGGNGLSFSGAAGVEGSTFSVTVNNPVAGAYYTAYTTTDLRLPFTAECIVQAVEGDEVIPLGVDASPPSKFVKIVASVEPPEIGDPLPED